MSAKLLRCEEERVLLYMFSETTARQDGSTASLNPRLRLRRPPARKRSARTRGEVPRQD